MIKIENLSEIKFDEHVYNEEFGIHSFYFIAPKDILEGRYPESESAEILVEFQKSYEDEIVKISPTKNGEDYDWEEVYLDPHILCKLIHIALNELKNL